MSDERLFAGRYRLERRLGVGGMATVQLAMDTRLERLVAVKLLAEHLETSVVPLVEVDGETVSSSHIRGLIAAGEVGTAARFLGGPFLLEGEVAHGDARGRELGMPTANIVPDDSLVSPGHGVYAAWAHGHPAAVNVDIDDEGRTVGLF